MIYEVCFASVTCAAAHSFAIATRSIAPWVLFPHGCTTVQHVATRTVLQH
jgi:hypothetical protein